MRTFKAVVAYENPICEETVELEARSEAEARSMCEAMMAEFGARMEALESANVYCSKKAVSCQIVERGWREQILCSGLLEDDV